VPGKKEKQPLSATHPELAKEADGWNPNEIVAGSNKKLPWKCSKKHKWSAKVSHRANGSNCPFCSGRIAITGVNDLGTLYPELAQELVGADPTKIMAGTHKNFVWKCFLGHTWKATPKNRTTVKSGCPYCANQLVLKGFNDLSTTNPKLAMEVVSPDPTTITSGSGKKVKWKCSLGHIWSAPVGRRANGAGCPFCSGRFAWRNFNDLAFLDPKLASEIVDVDPTTITLNSNKRYKWKCPSGHQFTAAVATRRSGSTCSYCSNKKVLTGFNDLKTTHPEIAKEADGWDPSKVIAGSRVAKNWVCTEQSFIAEQEKSELAAPPVQNRVLTQIKMGFYIF
jgi:Probable Zinc-ribbon domain